MASVQSAGRVWKRDLSGPDLSSLLAFIRIAVVLVTWGATFFIARPRISDMASVRSTERVEETIAAGFSAHRESS